MDDVPCILQRLFEYCDQVVYCRETGDRGDWSKLLGELDAYKEIENLRIQLKSSVSK